jgi:hypothetical protein
MKISELITTLGIIKNMHGDMQVGIIDTENSDFKSIEIIQERKRNVGDDKELGAKFIGME